MPPKKFLAAEKRPVAVQLIERRIYLVRGQKVMLDFDLADLYEVYKGLKPSSKTQPRSVPPGFHVSAYSLGIAGISYAVTICDRIKRNLRFQPYAFTKHGIAMLSSVLRSKRAIEVNIAIMRTFTKMREMLESNEQLNRKFAAVIRKLSEHDNYFRSCSIEL